MSGYQCKILYITNKVKDIPSLHVHVPNFKNSSKLLRCNENLYLKGQCMLCIQQKLCDEIRQNIIHKLMYNNQLLHFTGMTGFTDNLFLMSTELQNMSNLIV